MTSERWLQIERLFHAALELPVDRRAAFVNDSSGGDAALQLEVQSLLDQSTQADDFLETSGAGPAMLIERQRRSSLIGRRLSQYEITEWIGAGGMG